MFWITVGQASRQTAPAIGPSTIERSNLDAEDDGEDGWIPRFYFIRGALPLGLPHTLTRGPRQGE
jgi:hypothetical protein